MSKFERHFNRVWGWVFVAFAVAGLAGIATGHFQHFITLFIGIVLSASCFYENQRSRK